MAHPQVQMVAKYLRLVTSLSRPYTLNALQSVQRSALPVCFRLAHPENGRVPVSEFAVLIGVPGLIKAIDDLLD
jgi:hypothetical protein